MAAEVIVEELPARLIDDALLAAAKISSAAKVKARIAKTGPLSFNGHDRLNKDQVHAPERPEAVKSALLKQFHALARRPESSKPLQSNSKFSVQDWNTDPLNNPTSFTFVTWWHVFNVEPLTKYEVIARIFHQLERTNRHFSESGGGPTTFKFVFGGASFYPAGPGGRYSCSNPDTYRASIAAAKSPSRYLNTVVCNRGDGLLGEASFPYDINGQAYPLLEEDPRHMIQIDPEALAGGAYGSDTQSRQANFELGFNGPTWSHLLGHFFGLAHIFQDDEQCPAGGPDFDNDGVSDTPIQELPYAAVDCANDKRDCGDDRAYDLTNLMGFALCATTWTSGQEARMKDMIIEFHPLLASRQDCEANPCGKNFDCTSEAVAFASDFGSGLDTVKLGKSWMHVLGRSIFKPRFTTVIYALCLHTLTPCVVLQRSSHRLPPGRTSSSRRSKPTTPCVYHRLRRGLLGASPPLVAGALKTQTPRPRTSDRSTAHPAWRSLASMALIMKMTPPYPLHAW